MEPFLACSLGFRVAIICQIEGDCVRSLDVRKLLLAVYGLVFPHVWKLPQHPDLVICRSISPVRQKRSVTPERLDVQSFSEKATSTTESLRSLAAHRSKENVNKHDTSNNRRTVDGLLQHTCNSIHFLP